MARPYETPPTVREPQIGDTLRRTRAPSRHTVTGEAARCGGGRDSFKGVRAGGLLRLGQDRGREGGGQRGGAGGGGGPQWRAGPGRPARGGRTDRGGDTSRRAPPRRRHRRQGPL